MIVQKIVTVRVCEKRSDQKETDVFHASGPKARARKNNVIGEERE
jgi:hypothetical protein